MKILIADDDPQIIRALKVTLGARGYDILTAADGREALDQTIAHQPDLVILDLGMPQLNGIEVIQNIRGWSKVPILVVSGRTGSTDKVDALDAGADDYVTKPFSIDELLARIRALTRRSPADDSESVVVFADVHVDFSAKQITRREGTDTTIVRLTPTEWRLLDIIMHSGGRLVTREEILTEVWGPLHAKDTGYLRLYFAQLRRKLEPVPSRPRYIVTVQGMGYRFVATGEKTAAPPNV